MSLIGRNSLLLKFGFESRSKSCSVSDLGISFISTVIIVLLSGPNSMFAMAISARDGKCAGCLGVLGIFTGDEILMMLWVAGVTSLIQTTPILFMTLELFDVVYVTSIISIAVYTRRRLDQGHWFGRLGKALAGSAIVSYGLEMALTS
jgi:threonine/homoserine/homoserine lactone efflux protein